LAGAGRAIKEIFQTGNAGAVTVKLLPFGSHQSRDVAALVLIAP